MLLSSRKGRAGAAVLAASVVAGGIALGVGPAGAATSTAFTITSLSSHLLPATTANQVFTVTGTGFAEDLLASVSISGCTTDPMYIVTSATSLVLKTAADCAVGTNNVITLTDLAGDTVVSTPASATATIAAAQKLDFVAPPTLATIVANTTYPVIELNTAGQTGYDQVRTAPVTGGTTIKVTAGGTAFASSTAFPLAASLGGVALTTITPHFASGTTGPVDYFTGKVGAHAAGAVALSVTSAGVTKSFTNAQTGFSYAGTTISIAPAFGASDGGNVVKITGAGFVPSGAGASTVTVCGVSAPVVTTGSTATLLNVTVPAFTDATVAATDPVDGPCTVKVTTGSIASVVNPGSTYTYVAQG